MIRTVINKFLKAVLSELFTDSGGRDNISLSMGGADLFARYYYHYRDFD